MKEPLIELQEGWKNIKLFIRQNIVPIIFLFIYIAFISYWEEFIGKFFVDTFLCHFESSIICDIVFGVITIYSFLNIFLSKAKKIGKLKIVTSIILYLFWIYYRFISDRFVFIPLQTIGYIKYVDAIVIYIASEIIGVVLKKKDSAFTFNDGFNRDIPIEDDEEDILGRKIFAHDAVDKLLRTDTTHDSFSFGVVSAWGMGKTSFMNLMKRWIEKNYSQDCIVIDFNPWLYSNNTNIIYFFFNELSKHLKPYDTTLANGIIDYSKALSTIGTTETKVASTIIDLLHQPSKLEDKIETIKQSICQINKKVVIFVDDIDRLDPDEIVEILKLIRNISNFPYMYFVIAYDKEYLIECLKNKIPTKEIDFTEKIFQTEFYLPQCTKDTIRDYIYTSISKLIADNKNEDLYDSIYGISILKGYIIDSISTIREVKRILNSFSSSYMRLKDEVNICDLFFLEILKNKYPTIFSILDKNRRAVLINSGNSICELYDGSNHNESDFLFIDKPLKIILKQYINDNKEELHIKDSDIKNIENILDALFPRSFTAHKKGINDTHYIDRYFHISLLESDISDKEFENVLQLNIDDIKPIFKDWAVNKGIALSAKLERFQVKNKEELKKYIRILLYSTTILPFLQRNCTFITNFINEIGAFNEDKTISDDDKDFIKDALQEYGYSYGICEYLRSVAFDENLWDYPLSRDELNSIRHIIFKDCLEKCSDDTENVIQGFYGTADVIWENGHRKYSYKQDNIELMRTFAISHFADFIKYTISYFRPNRNHEYKVNTFPLSLWESWDNYLSFIKDIKEDNPFIAEYEKFLGECKKTKYEEYVHFEFIHIKLDES